MDNVAPHNPVSPKRKFEFLSTSFLSKLIDSISQNGKLYKMSPSY